MVGSVDLQPGKQIQPRRAGLLASPGRHLYLLSLLLIILTVALYYPVKSHPFVNYDDNVYVTENLHVQSGLNWDTVIWALSTNDAGNWHPLTWLSHALDFELYDMNPGGHHQTNLLLHVATPCCCSGCCSGRRVAGPKLHGGSAVRGASHQRGIGGVDLGAQEPAQHVIFSARAGGLPLVRAASRAWPICAGRNNVCLGSHGQAADHHFAFCSAAYGITGHCSECPSPPIRLQAKVWHISRREAFEPWSRRNFRCSPLPPPAPR